jgi:hypothetical protein
MLHNTPECNRQSAERTECDEPNPKLDNTQRSAGKVMASVFWDARGIKFIDNLRKSQTINSEYNINAFKAFKRYNQEKQPHLKKKKVLLYQDNAPCHKSIKTTAKLHE